MPRSEQPRRLLTNAELDEIVPYSRTHRWRLEKAGQFPSRVTLGENRVCWWQDEIQDWIDNRVRAGHRIQSPRRRTPTTNGGEDR